MLSERRNNNHKKGRLRRLILGLLDPKLTRCKSPRVVIVLVGDYPMHSSACLVAILVACGSSIIQELPIPIVCHRSGAVLIVVVVP